MGYRLPTPAFVPQCRVRHPNEGLGVVESVEHHLVRIRFDNGNTLMVNPRTAGVQRAAWQPKQAVIIRHKRMLQGVIVRVREEQGLFVYYVRIDDGRLVAVPEANLDDLPEAQSPDERLARQEFGDPKLFYYRTIGHYLACARQQLGASGIAARIIPKPHQIFVTKRVVDAPRQRFLLADEVGLGKTIETGLIIQELWARGSLDRVLIVVPANLLLQWLYELHYKFNNEEFKLFDTARVREEQAKHPGENVWEIGRYIICSHGYIATHREVWDDMLQVPWDMVIFDEAHHIRRQLDSSGRRSATALYHFASQISQRTRGLLLLTATPMQLDPFELFSLVEILDPALFYSYEYFEEQREQNKTLNAAIKGLAELDRLNAQEQAQLLSRTAELLGQDDFVTDIFVSQRVRDQVVEQLVSRHLLSEIMIRNRKRLVGGFTRRLPYIIPVALSEAEHELYDAVITYIRSVYRRLEPRKQGFVGFILVNYQKRLTSSLYAFQRSLERRLAKLVAQQVKPMATVPAEWTEADPDELTRMYGEQLALVDGEAALDMEIDGLSDLLDRVRAIHTDAKYAALIEALTEIFHTEPGERVLIFTQFLDTLVYLQQELQAHWKVGVFHGALSPRDKDLAIARFQRDEVQILVTTEAGGEGRNLQFCHILVNYDLPWNPMKVEQRIGRLDRIGQECDVLICNFALQDTIEERVLEVLNKRIHAFEETVGGLDPILGQMEMDIQKIVLETRPNQLDHVLAAYADHLEAEVERARQADEAMRDFILDQRSFGTRMAEAFDDNELRRLERHQNKWSKSLLKHIGASIRDLGSDTFSVKLGRDVAINLSKLTRDTYQLTFNYQCALQDVQAEYGTFGHPLFDALIDYVTGESFTDGVTARRTMVDVDHAGFRGFQFNFVVTVKSLQETQHAVVVVVDEQGRERPELRDLVLDSFDWRNAPAPFDLPALPQWSTMAEHARDMAEAVVDRRWNAEVGSLKVRRQELYSTERRRIEQYCNYRETEGRRKVLHDERILERLRQSERDEDRRVIPMWERTVENSTVYLKTLAQERERLMAELAQRLDITYSYELLNAAWIEVIAPHSD